jgi:hypothetical protein
MARLFLKTQKVIAMEPGVMVVLGFNFIVRNFTEDQMKMFPLNCPRISAPITVTNSLIL